MVNGVGLEWCLVEVESTREPLESRYRAKYLHPRQAAGHGIDLETDRPNRSNSAPTPASRNRKPHHHGPT